MDSTIKIEEDDGRWTFLPEVGKVRSGPRGNRYRERHHSTDLAQRSLPLTENDGLKDQRLLTPGATGGQHSRNSTSSGNLGDDEESIIKMEESPTDGLPPGNYMQQLSQMFGEIQRRNNHGDPDITQSRTEYPGYQDERRDHNHLPTRKRTREVAAEDERLSSLFISESPSSLNMPSNPTIFDDLDEVKRRRFDRDTPTPPSTPPLIECSLPDRHCRCPVGFECPKKDNLKSDCRTLTIEYKEWQNHGRQLDPEE